MVPNKTEFSSIVPMMYIPLVHNMFFTVAENRPNRVSDNEISRFLKFLEFECFPFVPFGFDPGFEQLSATAAQSIFQIQKGQTGSL